MVLYLVSWLLNILLILLAVAFFTLFERKVMSLVHLRMGPVKTSISGLLQPLLDAFKLLSKQQLQSLAANKLTYYSAPHLSLFLSLTFWLLIPTYVTLLTNSYSLLAFLLIGSMMVYGNLMAGWSSNSKYSLLGSLRSVAQSISYEAILTTLIIYLLVLHKTYCISSMAFMSSLWLLTILPLWFFVALAETHRAPFDFGEAESELVSGFNTEYSGKLFAYLFLSEYSSLLFSSTLIYHLFFGWLPLAMHPMLIVVGTLYISYLFIIIRVSFCRFRYDYLMYLAWKILLPVSLCLLLTSYYFI